MTTSTQAADLVAPPIDGHQAWFDSVVGLGPIAEAARSIRDGDFATLAGLSASAGAVVDAADWVIDPVHAAGASVAGLLMDHVQPLPRMLDSLAGDPASVAAAARTWRRVSTHLADVAAQYRHSSAALAGHWEGDAAAAHALAAEATALLVEKAGEASATLAGALVGASAVVGFVRATVRDLIADLVGWITSLLVDAGLTLGVGLVRKGPLIARTVQRYVVRAVEWLTRLKRAITSLCDTLRVLSDALAGARRAVRRFPTSPQSVTAQRRAIVEPRVLGVLDAARKQGNAAVVLGALDAGATAANDARQP